MGRDKLGAGWDTLLARTRFVPVEETRTLEQTATSAFEWTPEAVARLNRVPAGFMRDMTREEVERVAREKAAATIDLAVCEEGIAHARETMNEVIAGYEDVRPLNELDWQLLLPVYWSWLFLGVKDHVEAMVAGKVAPYPLKWTLDHLVRRSPLVASRVPHYDGLPEAIP